MSSIPTNSEGNDVSTPLTKEEKELANHFGNEAATWYWQNSGSDNCSVERACIMAAKNTISALSRRLAVAEKALREIDRNCSDYAYATKIARAALLELERERKEGE